MSEPNVVRFPNRRSRTANLSGDERLVSEIRKAWRKLAKSIRSAREAGLDVDTHFSVGAEPIITRRL